MLEAFLIVPVILMRKLEAQVVKQESEWEGMVWKGENADSLSKEGDGQE